MDSKSRESLQEMLTANTLYVRPHVLRLDPGEKIMECVLRYVTKNQIHSGFLSGIGATSSAEIGWFNPIEKGYTKTIFDEPCEITSLVGNIAWFKDDPVAHTHITLGRKDFSVVGGHLFEATVGVTCEIWITQFNFRVKRSENNPFGLKLIDFKAK